MGRRRNRVLRCLLAGAGVFTIALLGWSQEAKSPNVVQGAADNGVAEGVVGATIAGGGSARSPQRVEADFGTVGGGAQNAVTGQGGTVSGGFDNAANGVRSTVGGGFGNAAEGQFATVAGGRGNAAAGFVATVFGG